MAAADVHAGMIGRDQRDGDAEVVASLPRMLSGSNSWNARPTSVAFGPKRDVALVPGEFDAGDGLPFQVPLTTVPMSRMVAASEPEVGPVSEKHGISSPRARRGR